MNPDYASLTFAEDDVDAGWSIPDVQRAEKRRESLAAGRDRPRAHSAETLRLLNKGLLSDFLRPETPGVTPSQ
jgi:hypothetical protein